MALTPGILVSVRDILHGVFGGSPGEGFRVADPSPRGWVLIQHACVLKHVCPLSTGASVAVLEMLPEVVRPVELLGRVALTELVHLLQMPDALVPIQVSGMSRRAYAGPAT